MRNNLSIAVLTPTLLIKGGTQNQLLHLALELQKAQKPFKIVTFVYDPHTTYPEFQSLPIVAVVDLRKPRFWARMLDGAVKLSRVNRETAFLWLAFLFQKRYVRLLEHTMTAVLNPHDWFSSWIAVQAKKQFNPEAKIVMMLNDMPPSYGNQTSAKNAFINRKDHQYHPHIDRIMVLDKVMQKKAEAYYHSIPVDVVRSGINLELYQDFSFDQKKVRQKLHVPPDDIVMVCASVPTAHRRFQDAIMALHRISNDHLHLLIIGDLTYDRPYGESLKNLVTQLQEQKRVHFINRFLPFAERSAYIASSDIFIFPNEHQTWGLGVIEAQALRVPCVVSNGAGVHEVLTDHENALIYTCGDVGQLEKCLRTLIDNHKLRHRLSDTAQKFVSQNFSWQKYALAVEDVFDKTLAN